MPVQIDKKEQFNYQNRVKYELAIRASKESKGQISVKDAYLKMGGAIFGEPDTMIGVSKEMKPVVLKEQSKQKAKKDKKKK